MVQLAPLDLSESVLKDVRERRWLPLLVDCPHGGTRNVVVRARVMWVGRLR